MTEKLYSKLGEKKYIRKVDESFYTFLTRPSEVEKYVEFIEKCQKQKLWCNQVLLIIVYPFIASRFLKSFWSRVTTDNTIHIIKNKLKEFLDELKKSTRQF